MTQTRFSPREICRSGLDVLVGERLSALAIGLGVDPTGKSDAVAKRLARNARLGPERLLDFMTVFELGDLCRELGVDSHGRCADVLRARILDVEAYEAKRPPQRDELAPIPKVLLDAKQVKHARFRRTRAIYLVRRAWNVILWSASASAVTYFLMGFLTRDQDTRTFLAGVGLIACAIVKIRGMGRFGGIFFYGVPLIAATYAGYSHDMLDLEMASQSRLGLVWGSSIVLGALIGISEEIGSDMW